jgi:cob(I)alamin adenosyltransferase
MSIYTKFGDAGQTRRIDGETISKTSPQVEALGTVDELSSHLGLCIAEARELPERRKRLNKVRQQRLAQLAESLLGVQRHLHGVGAMLATAGTDRQQAVTDVEITAETITQMEQWIDWAWGEMPPLEGFILPGGSELACRLHVARSVCRRAERSVIRFIESGQEVPPLALTYLNRLSDTLFALARLANFDEKGSDILARPGDGETP